MDSSSAGVGGGGNQGRQWGEPGGQGIRATGDQGTMVSERKCGIGRIFGFCGFFRFWC